jgi:hypothetical protein
MSQVAQELCTGLLGFYKPKRAELEQIAAFVNTPAEFICLGGIKGYGFLANAANWKKRHKAGHRMASGSVHQIAQETDAQNGVRRKHV